MKKNAIVVILSVLIGYILSCFMYNQYDKDAKVTIASINSNTYYLLEIGVYDNYDSMISSNNRVDNYIYLEDNNLYKVYTCITSNELNNTKIIDYYKSIGYESTMKEYNLSNDRLYSDISKIDILMNETNDNDSISALCKESLTKYKEDQ